MHALERRMHCHGGDRGFAHSDDLDDVTGHLPVLRNTPQLTSQVPKLISLFPMKFAIYPFQGVGGGLGLGSLGKVEGFGLDRAGSVALAAHRLAAASSSVVSAAVQSNVVRSRLSPGRDKVHARAMDHGGSVTAPSSPAVQVPFWWRSASMRRRDASPRA